MKEKLCERLSVLTCAHMYVKELCESLCGSAFACVTIYVSVGEMYVSQCISLCVCRYICDHVHVCVPQNLCDGVHVFDIRGNCV